MATLARGLDLVAPSGTVHLLPGAYIERCHLKTGGTALNHLTLKAEIPGTVRLTWQAHEQFARRLNWRKLAGSPDLYSAAVNQPVYRLRSGEQELFRVPWGGLNALREITSKPGAMGAFLYEDGELTVFLPNQQHPKTASLVFHRPVPEPREWGEFRSANLWVEASHITISGLHFDQGIGSAVRLWNAEDIRIVDCVFQGATYGILCDQGLRPCKDLIVERCLYHNYPQHLWRRNWLDWQQIYAAYSSSTLIASSIQNLQVRDSAVVHGGDALRITTPLNAPPDSVVVERNLLAYFTDDAIELDGPCSNVIFRNNLVVDGHESLGTSPVEQGPCVIEGNVFLHPQVELNGAQMKLLGNQPGQRIRNITVRNNIFMGNWLVWIEGIPIDNVLIDENLYAVRRHLDPLWPPGVKASRNRYVDLPSTPLTYTPDEAIKFLQAHLDNSFPGSREILMNRTTHRYGPVWWDWKRERSTKELEESLQSMRTAL